MQKASLSTRRDVMDENEWKEQDEDEESTESNREEKSGGVSRPLAHGQLIPYPEELLRKPSKKPDATLETTDPKLVEVYSTPSITARKHLGPNADILNMLEEGTSCGLRR